MSIENGENGYVPEGEKECWCDQAGVVGWDNGSGYTEGCPRHGKAGIVRNEIEQNDSKTEKKGEEFGISPEMQKEEPTMESIILNHIDGLSDEEILHLISKGEIMNLPENNPYRLDFPVLDSAVMYGKLETAKWLMQKGHKPNKHTWDVCFVSPTKEKMNFAIALLDHIEHDSSLWKVFGSRWGNHSYEEIFLPVAAELNRRGIKSSDDYDFPTLKNYLDMIDNLRNA